MSDKITRRDAIKSSAGLLGLGYFGAYTAFTKDKNKRFKIGACDWSIGQTAHVKAMETGKKNRARRCPSQLGNPEQRYALETEENPTRIQRCLRKIWNRHGRPCHWRIE